MRLRLENVIINFLQINLYEKMLTRRERQVMDLVLMGHTTSEIGQILNISETTVVTHKQNVKEKLCAKNSCHCVALYLKQAYPLEKS
jgi:DNA-binding CsgD family transcriptional regulator